MQRFVYQRTDGKITSVLGYLIRRTPDAVVMETQNGTRLTLPAATRFHAVV